MALDVAIGYRLAQFWWALSAKDLTESESYTVKSTLSDDEWALFQRYASEDQRHSFQVYRTVHDAGHEQPDLLKAALLHDIGKTKIQLSVWDRTLIVISEAILPQKTADWGRGECFGWKRPFVVRSNHPEWGAEMAKEAGSTELVVHLIKRHQDPQVVNPQDYEDELLSLLQWADSKN